MFTFARKVHGFYVAVLGTVFVGLLASLFYLWSGGPVQMEGVFSMVEASMKLEHLKKGKASERIEEYVQSDRSRQALQDIQI